jgi:hypothetical protein
LISDIWVVKGERCWIQSAPHGGSLGRRNETIWRMGPFARWAGSPLCRAARRRLCPGIDARRGGRGRARHHRPRDLLDDDFKSAGGKNITAMTLWSWSRVYGAAITQVVEPSAMPVVDHLAEECIESIFDWLVRQGIEQPLEQSFLSIKNLATVEPWRSLAMRNTPAPCRPASPSFLRRVQPTN